MITYVKHFSLSEPIPRRLMGRKWRSGRHVKVHYDPKVLLYQTDRSRSLAF